VCGCTHLKSATFCGCTPDAKLFSKFTRYSQRKDRIGCHYSGPPFIRGVLRYGIILAERAFRLPLFLGWPVIYPIWDKKGRSYRYSFAKNWSF
jgi:hypothetical protein